MTITDISALSGITVFCHQQDRLPSAMLAQATLVLTPNKPCPDLLDLWSAEHFTVVKTVPKTIVNHYIDY